jgi:hypothetical protein
MWVISPILGLESRYLLTAALVREARKWSVGIKSYLLISLKRALMVPILKDLPFSDAALRRRFFPVSPELHSVGF